MERGERRRFVTVRNFRKYKRKYVAEGFKADVLTAIQMFINTEALEFDGFAKIWRDSSLSLLYMGRENAREMCEFTHECFAITLNLIICHISGVQAKIGALYMLYSLYVKQPMKIYKIRVTSKEWKEIMQLWKLGREQKIYQLIYIISKMIEMSAFHFVMHPSLMGPDISALRAIVHDSHLTMTVVDDNWNRFIKEVWDNSHLQTLNALDQKYKETANSLRISQPIISTARGQSTEKALMLAELAARGSSDLFDAIKAYEKKNVKSSNDNIGLRRAKLKKRQMAAEQLSRRNQRLSKLATSTDSFTDDAITSEDGQRHRYVKPENPIPKSIKKESTKVLQSTSDFSDRELELFGLGIVEEGTKISTANNSDHILPHSLGDEGDSADERVGKPARSGKSHKNRGIKMEAGTTTSCSEREMELSELGIVEEPLISNPRANMPKRKSAQKCIEGGLFVENADEYLNESERIDKVLVEDVSDVDSDYRPPVVEMKRDKKKIVKKSVVTKRRRRIKIGSGRTRKESQQLTSHSDEDENFQENGLGNKRLGRKIKGKKLRHHYDSKSSNSSSDADDLGF